MQPGQKQKEVVVFTNGVFDVLHTGHVALLHFAKSLGDKLIVGINSDRAVKLLKGPARPFNSEQKRKAALEEFSFVDEVVIFDDTNHVPTLLAMNPDVFVKGAEWTPEEVRARDGIPMRIAVRTFPLVMETADRKYSTTTVLEKMETRATLAEKAPNLREAIEKFKDLKIAVVGDIMLDRYTYGGVERISQEASVPVVTKQAEKYTLGGAANVANNLWALGAVVFLGGVIGHDTQGEQVRALLAEKNIDASAISVVHGRPTIEKHRIVAGLNHQMLRLDIEEKRHLLPREEDECYQRIAPIIQKCDAIIFSDYAKGFFSEGFAQRLIALARSEGKIMLADIKPQNKHYFLGVDVVSPNLKEAREMAGLEIVEEIGPRIVQEFGAHAVVTRGGEGMSLFRREDASHYRVPGKQIKIFDVSGAGDTSIAVMALGFAAGLDIADAVVLANEAGSLVVQKAETATISRDELFSTLTGTNHVEHISMVPKVWGYEQWLENNERYCCKILGLNKGYQCSLHYHKNKDEMFLVTVGHVRLELGDEIIYLRPGSFARVPAGIKHRFAGLEDSTMIEVSTHHEDSDSYRIEESRKMDSV